MLNDQELKSCVNCLIREVHKTLQECSLKYLPPEISASDYGEIFAHVLAHFMAEKGYIIHMMAQNHERIDAFFKEITREARELINRTQERL